MIEYNDYELVFLAQENNEIALDILYNKYYNIIVNKVKKIYYYMRCKGVEYDDVFQEGLLGFYESIMGFDQNNCAVFYTFANICIDRRLNDFIKKYDNNKNYILNNAINIDDDNFGLSNLFCDNFTPENICFSESRFNKFCELIRDTLTCLEGFVFELKIVGFSYYEISDILDIEIKNVYNAMDRIKFKIKKVLNV